MKMRVFPVAVLAAGFFTFAATTVFAQSDFNQGRGKAVVTVVPQKNASVSPEISENQLALKVNGKPATVSKWERLQGSSAPLQLVVMIDDGARRSIGTQLKDIAQFIQKLPPSAEVAVAYMDNGRANFSGPLSRDHSAVARELRQPLGQPGVSGSPYFCLSDLAHHWPSNNQSARRTVVMISDGVDNYEVRYNPEDPYLQAAIHDAVRSRISVYSIYWRSGGAFDRSWYAASDGQNLLAELTDATGGYSYWQGVGNPVSLQPYFENLSKRLSNQYGLTFTVPLSGNPGVEALSLRANGASAKLVAPKQVYVGHPASGQEQGAAGQ